MRACAVCLSDCRFGMSSEKNMIPTSSVAINARIFLFVPSWLMPRACRPRAPPLSPGLSVNLGHLRTAGRRVTTRSQLPPTLLLCGTCAARPTPRLSLRMPGMSRHRHEQIGSAGASPFLPAAHRLVVAKRLPPCVGACPGTVSVMRRPPLLPPRTPRRKSSFWRGGGMGIGWRVHHHVPH